MERSEEDRSTESVVEETGVGDPLADREPEQGPREGEFAGGIEPEDATPEEGMERPDDGPDPDPDHVVEEKGQDQP